MLIPLGGGVRGSTLYGCINSKRKCSWKQAFY